MGLRFTDEEEREFQEMTKLQPVGIGQHLGVWADKIANTVGMFLCLLLFSILAETVFKSVLNQMLFISNTYQLVALPILGIATGLSTVIILRFLFRILLEIRKEFRETRATHAETVRVHVELNQKFDELEQDNRALAEMLRQYIERSRI